MVKKKCKIEVVEDLDVRNNSTDHIILSIKKPKYRQYKQRFRSEWFNNLLFKSWLKDVRGDPEKAYCSICDKYMIAKYTDLTKHITTKKHSALSPSLELDVKLDYPKELESSTRFRTLKIKKPKTSLDAMCADGYLKVLKSLARIPTLKSAVICHSAIEDVLIEACWTTRNFSSKARITSENHYLFKNYNVVQVPPTVKDGNIILKSYNGRGDKHAYISQDDEKCHIGIVDKCGQIITLNLKDLNKHGKVYTDPELASLIFSPDSTRLAFVAEKKRAKPTSFLDVQPTDDFSSWGRKNEYLDNWGEQMEDFHKSCIVIVNIESEEISTIDFPNDLCGGSLIWNPEGRKIVGTAFVTEPFRLGLIYCQNRESVIFEIDLEGNFDELTPRGKHVQSPRFNQDGSTLVFLRCAAEGPHVMATQLCQIELDTKEVDVLVDIVMTEEEVGKSKHIFTGFTGYSSLPTRCFSKDGTKVAVNAHDNYETAVYIISTDTGAINRLAFDSSITAHDWDNGWLLLSTSSMADPTRLFLWNEDWASNSFIQISEDIQIDGVRTDWIQKFRTIKSSTLANSSIPAIYLGPTEPCNTKRPLIVWPHGGPHGMISNVFMYQPLFYLRLGYSIVFPNYRGSIGQGRKCIHSLPGHVGTYDVNDVHGAALDCLSRFEDVLDPERVVLVGGSHGGFLNAHLSAQFPDFYKAVASRNPVIDISTMYEVSDIPDWSFIESGSIFKPCAASVCELDAMRKVSPIDIIQKVKAPTLFMLGKNDKRVPMSQGMFCHKVLKANNVETSVFVYDDNHPLGKVEVETDTVIQTALWFDKHLKQDL